MKKIGIIALLVLTGVVYYLYTPNIALEDLKDKYCDKNSRFIEIDGLSVHYKDEGKGPVLVLIHGTASSLHTWDAWSISLEKNYRIVRLDMPAFGITGPNPQNDYSIQFYVDFLNQFLDAIEIDSLYLAGNSLGGRISYEYARQHPDRIKKLILIDASGLIMPGDPESTLAFKIAKTPVLNSLMTWVTPKSLHKKSILEVYSNPDLVTDTLIQRYYELMLRPGNRKAFVSRMNTNMLGNPLKPGDITCPTMIQWGAEDRWIPVGHAQEFKRLIPGAEIKIYKAGHVPMEEKPLETVKDLKVFLQK